ncbi:hypothetical protein [Micromonospora sp. WMMD1082]|uniref:hypothetical protein n=1 Tax=Micromonospora sp. WMMD1082 TaxID=3016104 RepID=UPI002417F293|nr:hypothetical protein [Micromonospora sp. WMMD1082]MDG4796216.1 hypothetical protein [Micromonospora sp. WMMD1082]
MRAEIEVNGIGGGRVALDGKDVSGGVHGFTVTAALGEVTRLELDLSLFDVTTFDSAQTEVLIPEATRELLVGLGWIPPDGG